MTMPNFLIIGATKSGTTSLYNYLHHHPQIYMSPIKETNFFAYEGGVPEFNWWGEPPHTTLNSITDLATYQQLFAAATDEIAIGEASPYYLYNENAAERIHHYIPQAKLIAILRHPTDRAYSNYTHLIRDGREPYTDFAVALAQETTRRSENWSWDYFYQDMGFYYQQLKRYYERFPREQIKVFLYDELKQDPAALFASICAFLEVDTTFQPNFEFHNNVSGYPKSKALQRFIDQPNPLKPLIRLLLSEKIRQRVATKLRRANLEKPTMAPAVRQQLNQLYKDDILQLQALIQRDLAVWLA